MDQATDTLMAHYTSVKDMSNGKLVRISETGWPDEGSQNMESIPSHENQKKYV